jgi:catechol 2,3-dioxygenase-like lactoylglutathione lyase family enzyme
VDGPQPSGDHHQYPTDYRQENEMHSLRIMANLPVPDIDAAKGFYTEFLGLSSEEFNMGWVARYASPDTTANVQLVTRDATAPEDSVISVQTDDVEGAYLEAQQLGYQIVHPITTEKWGVRRFFVRAPDGNVINIAGHGK